MVKTIAEINEKIRKGDAVVVRADEMPEIVAEKGAEKAAKEVDVVTTGTYGAMCSSGAFLNFGHSNPPIKMQRVWLNEVEAYAGLAAVDCYIGATELSQDRGFEYGGSHVIEDLIARKEIKVRATAYPTDCYPKRRLETTVTLDDLNQAYLYNPRNNYQRYVSAVNLSDRKIRTYMGTLLPNAGNINFAGTGHISPLNNDPEYRTIGFGTKIFLGGAQGRIVGEGTQHSPQTQLGTIAVKGELRDMSTDYVRGGTLPEYGTSLFVGIGIPIPILNDELARSTAVTNDEIESSLTDYGVPRIDRPVLRKVRYSELITGKVELNGDKVKAAPLSSFKIAYDIMDELKKWIEEGEFTLANGVESLPGKREVKAMKVRDRTYHVSDGMTRKVHTASEKDSLKKVSELMVEKGVDQIPIVNGEGKVVGIVTSFDFTKALSQGKRKLSEVMTRNVITSKSTDTIDETSRKLEKHGYNATPVVDDEGKIKGIITVSDINRVYGRLSK
ncbi:MAG: CBS domain-containing protein [Candidatus Altiarchaeales archaeon]|nr:CBS domain-containing protein [Candidatus Altiarchaeales archaeon]MBD3415963.1 CBS domain-containing protein [Candidatus Altiarchaeales archaeon]